MTPDEVELTRRRLEEHVKARVEADLFRYYRNVGSIVIAVLAGVGFFIGWPQIQALIVTQVKGQVAEQVKAPVDAAKAAAIDAEKAAREAERLASGVLVQLEERQAGLKEDIGRINARYDAMTIDYGAARTRLADINSEFDGLQQAVNYFRELAKRDPVGRVEVESLKLSIAEIAARAGDLASAVAVAGPVQNDPQFVENVQKSLEQVATDQNEAIAVRAEAAIADPRSTSTVFVQFAGGSRDDIERVSAILRNGKWRIPGEERIALAASKRELRYFHDTDRPAAELLRDDYNNALRNAGFNLKVELRDTPTLVKSLPGKGVLEVWIEIPLRE